LEQEPGGGTPSASEHKLPTEEYFHEDTVGPAIAPAVSIMVDSDESATAAPIDQLTDVDNFLRNNYVQVCCI
jgi:hypothetical protein